MSLPSVHQFYLTLVWQDSGLSWKDAISEKAIETWLSPTPTLGRMFFFLNQADLIDLDDMPYHVVNEDPFMLDDNATWSAKSTALSWSILVSCSCQIAGLCLHQPAITAALGSR